MSLDDNVGRRTRSRANSRVPSRITEKEENAEHGNYYFPPLLPFIVQHTPLAIQPLSVVDNGIVSSTPSNKLVRARKAKALSFSPGEAMAQLLSLRATDQSRFASELAKLTRAQVEQTFAVAADSINDRVAAAADEAERRATIAAMNASRANSMRRDAMYRDYVPAPVPTATAAAAEETPAAATAADEFLSPSQTPAMPEDTTEFPSDLPQGTPQQEAAATPARVQGRFSGIFGWFSPASWVGTPRSAAPEAANTTNAATATTMTEAPASTTGPATSAESAQPPATSASAQQTTTQERKRPRIEEDAERTPEPARKRARPSSSDLPETPSRHPRERGSFHPSHPTYNCPSTKYNNKLDTSLSTINEQAETTMAPEEPPEQSTPADLVRRRRTAKEARAARASRDSNAPYPMPDRGLEKFRRMRNAQREVRMLSEDDDIRDFIERQAQPAPRLKRVKVDKLIKIPHNRPGESSGTFRVPDLDSDDEMEVDEDCPERSENMFSSPAPATTSAPTTTPAPTTTLVPATTPAPATTQAATAAVAVTQNVTAPLTTSNTGTTFAPSKESITAPAAATSTANAPAAATQGSASVHETQNVTAPAAAPILTTTTAHAPVADAEMIQSIDNIQWPNVGLNTDEPGYVEFAQEQKDWCENWVAGLYKEWIVENPWALKCTYNEWIAKNQWALTHKFN